MKNLIEGVKVEIMKHNSEHIYLHAREQLIKKSEWYATEYCDSIDQPELTASTEAIVNALMDVKGILNITVRPYKLGISKSEMYSWEELYPQIILILSKYLPVGYNCFK